MKKFLYIAVVVNCIILSGQALADDETLSAPSSRAATPHMVPTSIETQPWVKQGWSYAAKDQLGKAIHIW